MFKLSKLNKGFIQRHFLNKSSFGSFKPAFQRKSGAGFTLIEVLIVIGIIAVLATIVIIAINPARQFAQARNSQRVSNANAILNAVGQRIADGKGTFAGLIWGSNPAQTCPGLTVGVAPLLAAGTDYPLYYDVDTGVVGGNLHIACLSPTYIPSYTIDPTSGSTTNTGYTLRIDGNGRITIKAPSAELGQTISVTR